MNILIVDDHPLYRDALARLVAMLFDDVTVLQANGLDAALVQLSALPHCELVLLDLGLPDAGERSAVAALRRVSHALRIVIVSSVNDREQVDACMQAGAVGFIPKSTSTPVLVEALRRFITGDAMPLTVDGASERTPPPAATSPLSPREREVLSMVAAGCSNKAIARALAIAEPTVRSHLTAIFRALGVENRTQAAREARLRGLVDD